MKPPIKPSWIETAEDIFKFHRSKLQSNEHWTATDTARVLDRSIGSVSENLKIARWLKGIYKEKIESFEYLKQAVKWIREEENRIKREGL